MLTHIRHHSRWVLDPGRQDYTLNFIIQLTKFYTFGVVARGPAHHPIQSGDPCGTGCPSTQAQWTDEGPSGHGETAEKRTASLEQYWFPIRAHRAKPFYQLLSSSNSTPPLLSHNLSQRHITAAHLHHR